MRVWSVILVALLVAACSLKQPDGAARPKPVASAIAGDAITVTPLPGPAATVAAKGGADLTPAAVAAPAAAQKPPPARPKDMAPKAAAPAAAAAAAAAPALPPVSPEERACLRQGGQWGVAGKSGARTCVRYTKDGGKMCTRQSQCEGVCLARSNTCAPVKPLFGCNDVLQDDGVAVTLCID